MATLPPKSPPSPSEGAKATEAFVQRQSGGRIQGRELRVERSFLHLAMAVCNVPQREAVDGREEYVSILDTEDEGRVDKE